MLPYIITPTDIEKYICTSNPPTKGLKIILNNSVIETASFHNFFIIPYFSISNTKMLEARESVLIKPRSFTQQTNDEESQWLDPINYIASIFNPCFTVAKIPLVNSDHNKRNTYCEDLAPSIAKILLFNNNF